ncbi:hypothetical protein RG959_22980 [Domibacillus sp. 8LH]|uniref:hypothetical protein n=1 Tax=Domibacillus sp. 8LH TaxID=3073900 RepID=UPI0031753F04
MSNRNELREWPSVFKETKGSAVPKKSKVSTNEAAHIASILPEKFLMSNSKLANELPNEFIGEGEQQIKVSKQGAKEVKVFATLDYDNTALDLKGRYPFTPFDMSVHDAVSTLWAAGNQAFTPAMVYRAMNGLSDKEKVSPVAEKRVAESIEKSRSTKLTIDFTEQAKAHGVPIEKTKMDDMLLSARKHTVIMNNVELEAYVINSSPILYEYSKAINQIVKIPIEMLNTKKVLNSTPEVTVLRLYLLKRIEMMKNSSNNIHKNRIQYETIYKNIGIHNPNKDKTKALKKHIKTLLEYWEEQKIIKSFSEYKAGRVAKGIEIIY